MHHHQQRLLIKIQILISILVTVRQVLLEFRNFNCKTLYDFLRVYSSFQRIDVLPLNSSKSRAFFIERHISIIEVPQLKLLKGFKKSI